MQTDSTMAKWLKFERNGNCFERLDGRHKEPISTKYTFKNIDGKIYNIYISSRKKAYFIIKTKNGIERKIMLSKEITNIILKELEEKAKLNPKPNVIVDN